MKTNYLVLGSGMQGTAAAYDLAKFADPGSIVLADRELAAAQRAAERVNRLVGREIARPLALDALNPADLATALEPVDVLLSCVPYWMHPSIAVGALASGTSMLDLGGNTDVTLKTLGLDGEAKAAGVTLVPDCGLAPGLVNSLAVALMERMDSTESIRLYCGVLPQNPVPPFNYKVTFNVEGLVTEYDYEAVILRDGKVASVPTLTELETLTDTPLGTLEAFVTSGGTSTAPMTFEGKVTNYDYKTFRFPGHCERMKIYKDFGLWREDEIDVKTHTGTVKVRPKDVFVRVFGEELGKIQDRDQCVIRAEATGTKNGQTLTERIDMHDKEDEATGFSLAIHAAWVAAGQIPSGAIRYEEATKGLAFMAELRKRDVDFFCSWE